MCEEKLTSNPNRKGRFIEKQSRHYIVSVLLSHHQDYEGVILVISIDGCIKSVKIYKNLEKLYNKRWLFMTRKIGRLINESAFVALSAEPKRSSVDFVSQ